MIRSSAASDQMLGQRDHHAAFGRRKSRLEPSRTCHAPPDHGHKSARRCARRLETFLYRAGNAFGRNGRSSLDLRLASSTLSPARAARGPLTWSERLAAPPKRSDRLTSCCVTHSCVTHTGVSFGLYCGADVVRTGDGPIVLWSSLLVPVPMAPIGRPFCA